LKRRSAPVATARTVAGSPRAGVTSTIGVGRSWLIRIRSSALGKWSAIGDGVTDVSAGDANAARARHVSLTAKRLVLAAFATGAAMAAWAVVGSKAAAATIASVARLMKAGGGARAIMPQGMPQRGENSLQQHG